MEKISLFHQNSNITNNSLETFSAQTASDKALIDHLTHRVLAISINESSNCHEIRTKIKKVD